MCWFQIWHWFLKVLSLNSQILAFWAGNHQLSNLNEILPVPYSKGAYLKSDTGFWKFWAQMPKFGYFGPKSINFLILAKFRMYAISNVLISNLDIGFQNFLAQIPIYGHVGWKRINFVILTKFHMYPISKILI